MKMRKIMGVVPFLFAILMSSAIIAQTPVNFRTAKVGLQTWSAENLNIDHFRNGDEIPRAATNDEWIKAAASGQPAWCWYENDKENGSVHGRLYNWYAINDRRGLAPEGWHIPANSDWRLLVKNLRGIDVAAARLKNDTGWKKRKGTNDSGFAAMPSGYRDAEGNFKGLGETARFWSNSVPVDVKPSEKIFSISLSDNAFVLKYLASDKGSGFSVRCVKDSAQ